MRIPRRLALIALAVVIVCAAVTLPWGLVSGSSLPFGLLSLVTLVTIVWIMVWASRHPSE